MSTTGHDRAANLTAELQNKTPLDQALHYNLVMENDLTGRAVLAVLWAHRSQLTVHIVTEEPTASYVRALKTALETVRNAPGVHLIDHSRAHQLAAASGPLIWAIDRERTEQHTRATLEERFPDATLTPLFTGFDALDDNLPDQRHPLHELVLRDAIDNHARFLNFFGDRFNPLDLYERSKYPQWLTPPEDFDAALPQLWCRLVESDGSVISRRQFVGTLELQPDEMKLGNRLELDLTPLGKVFNSGSGVTMHCNTNSGNHGGLQLQVHRNHKLVHCSDIASSQLQQDVTLPRRRGRDSLTTVVMVTREPSDHPEASVIDLRLTISPPGAHAQPSTLSRFRTWVAGLPFRRQ